MKTRSFLSPASHAVKRIADHARWAGAAVILAVLAGCATGPNANPSDPFEPFNRGVFSFNEKVDEVVLVPVSTAYVNVLPSMVRTGVNNFFGNLGDIWSFANSVAQLKLQNSAETFMRVNVNTIFGLGGLIDVATEVGIDRRDEDFGKTLGRWGVGAGPYVVLPLLGPSTLRDTAAKPVDLYGDALNAVQDVAWRNSLTALRVVDKRSQYLRAGRLIDDAALDKYSFTRDAFLQRRRSQIQDGRAPDDDAGK
ncbi:VacJ family lipoprotein [Variovorax sp. UMC13]|uniref:MlaA family lipoprotein n=1 Tax=Variovorax sp. UMC13 TaxID=1862326 RepID=UPI0016048CE6|nr:VacJ family lipoprotein [Variovorax sp. UMC13]MBB1600596.1 ABC transporter [Variovorax sp. UMC13]